MAKMPAGPLGLRRERDGDPTDGLIVRDRWQLGNLNLNDTLSLRPRSSYAG